MLSLNEGRIKVLYSVITFLGLALAFYEGYLRTLPLRLQQFDGWQVGDWLIDYSGGVVRRGLSGEIVFFFVPDGKAAIATVIVVQLVLAAFLYGVVGILYWMTDRGPAWMMLVLSPAFLLFPALNELGNSRKELLTLGALGVVVLAHRFGKTEPGLWIASPLFVLGVFFHEALVVTLPAFAYFAFKFTGAKRAWLISGAYGAAAIGALVLASARPGDSQVRTAICSSWNERGIDQCTGSLTAIGMSTPESITFLANSLYPTYWAYLLPVALATLPFFALRFWPAERTITIIVVLAALPLFAVAWDYGRWIFLIVAQLSLLTLAQPHRMKPMRVPLYGALAFILLWGFQHYGRPITDGLGSRWISDFPSISSFLPF